MFESDLFPNIPLPERRTHLPPGNPCSWGHRDFPPAGILLAVRQLLRQVYRRTQERYGRVGIALSRNDVERAAGAGRGRRAVSESAGLDRFWYLSVRTCHCLRACHSERSEESCPLTGARAQQIPRCARNDKFQIPILRPFSSAYSRLHLLAHDLTSHHELRNHRPAANEAAYIDDRFRPAFDRIGRAHV